MSLIHNNESAVKFYSIAYRGNFTQRNDLENLPVTHKMMAFRTMVSSVLKVGFDNVDFDDRIYGYVLKPSVDLEEKLVDAGIASVQLSESFEFFNTEFGFERSMYRRVAKDIINILNQFCERKFYNGPAILMGRTLIDLSCLSASFSENFQDREFKQTAESLGGSAHASQYMTA